MSLRLNVYSVLLAVIGLYSPAYAGSVFLTCHDPDFHVAENAYNPTGARHIIQRGLAYVLDPAHNPFSASATRKFLFVESNIPVPSRHLRGKLGMIGSGFVEGVDFEHHDATTLAHELTLLGSKYASIVVASDFGGTLTQAELDILNSEAGRISTFLDAGGGLVAMAQTNETGLTPLGGHWLFVPNGVTGYPLSRWETNFSVTPLGSLLGLVDSDVSGNYCHCGFNPAPGLGAVDLDPEGHIISLAGRTDLTPTRAASWGALKLVYR